MSTERTDRSSTPTPATAAPRSAACEALEARSLMSVSWAGGALTVNGSNGNDTIVVDCQPSIPGYSLIRVRENGAVTQDWLLYQNAKGLTVYGNSGNDTIDLSALTFGATVFGGGENDTIKGGQAGDALFGNDGDDAIYGNAGSDTLDGGAGNDALFGGAGADAFWGGAGTDTANYADRTTPVFVTIDDVGLDGAVNEFDNVHADVENLTGGTGNDTLLGNDQRNFIQGNGGSDLICGGGGDDTLFGGLAYHNEAKFNNGVDRLFGGAGDDTLWAPVGGRAVMRGGSDDDVLYGAGGSDALYGDDGDDSLYGSGGADELYAGMGDNKLYGGEGADLLVAVGGGSADHLLGQGGSDSFWVDSGYAETTDASPAELAADHEHRVMQFEGFRTPAGFKDGQPAFDETAIYKDPLGEDLPDPLADAGVKWKNFSDHPLFDVNGPSPDDVAQGHVGDCWFASSLSGVARRNADAIRQRVTALGDGTYAVRFFSGGQQEYVRVDGDLPVDDDGNLYYTHETTGGAIWGAIVEKAEACTHLGFASYKALDGGSAQTALTELGGQTPGTLSWTTLSESTVLAKIDELLAGGNVVGFSTMDTDVAVQHLVVPNHIYSVVAVNKDKFGKAVSVTLRNPWGNDGVNPTGNPQDGYVTLTAHQAWVAVDALEFAKF